VDEMIVIEQSRKESLPAIVITLLRIALRPVGMVGPRRLTGNGT